MGWYTVIRCQGQPGDKKDLKQIKIKKVKKVVDKSENI